jgi:SP family sugar:H+ symporter-like MFS transporter
MKFFGSKRHEHAGEGQHLERKPSPDTDGRITFRACFMGLVASVSSNTTTSYRIGNKLTK